MIIQFVHNLYKSYFCQGRVSGRLSQTDGCPDRTTSQATWRGLAKWLPTARFIRGSSVLFTLFNCLTAPVYAVSLPILPAFIKTAELAFNKSAAFEPCQRPRRRMRSYPTRPCSFLQASHYGGEVSQHFGLFLLGRNAQACT